MSGGYISKITFNNNQSVEINANDIVVFVGANNVGKSQTLKDIYKLCDRKVPTMVVEDIDIVKYDVDLDKFLPTISHIKTWGLIKNFREWASILIRIVCRIMLKKSGMDK